MDDRYKTIVVLGCYRGGTSMIAGILRCLGVFMGESFGKEAGGSNHEDLDFQHKSNEVVVDMIHERDAEHNVWGWKDPMTVIRIGEYHEELRDPYFISVFRDPYAIAESENRYNKRPIDVGLKTAMGHLMYMCTFAEGYPEYPNLKVSYEKAIANKEKIVDDLIMFLGMTVSTDQRQKAIDFITPGKYVNI